MVKSFEILIFIIVSTNTKEDHANNLLHSLTWSAFIEPKQIVIVELCDDLKLYPRTLNLGILQKKVFW
jgi:hypothetical protein